MQTCNCVLLKHNPTPLLPGRSTLFATACPFLPACLPAVPGASSFETGLSSLIKGGSDLSSSSLRSLMAPSATAGMGVVAQRSLQDDFDGAVACLKGLVEVRSMTAWLPCGLHGFAVPNTVTVRGGEGVGARRGLIVWYCVAQRSLQDDGDGAASLLEGPWVCLNKGNRGGGTMGVVAQRSLQDDFDGAVACLKGLVEVRGLGTEGAGVEGGVSGGLPMLVQ